MKTYIGRRGGICEVFVEEENGVQRDLPLYLHVRSHSPTGFEWGYGGSGPAQLALAMLIDHFTIDRDGLPWSNIERAEALYQRFKFKVIARLPQKNWRLTSKDVENFVQTIVEERAREGAN